MLTVDAVQAVAVALLEGQTLRAHGVVAEPARTGHRLSSHARGQIVAGDAFDVARQFVALVGAARAMRVVELAKLPERRVDVDRLAAREPALRRAP